MPPKVAPQLLDPQKPRQIGAPSGGVFLGPIGLRECQRHGPVQPDGGHVMKRTFLAALAILGAFAFLVLSIADREMRAGFQRLSEYEFPSTVP